MILIEIVFWFKVLIVELEFKLFLFLYCKFLYLFFKLKDYSGMLDYFVWLVKI